MIKINETLVNNVITQANQSQRKRKNYNFHKDENDLLQRMLNVLNISTYARPHKHENPDKREVFVILKGKIAVLEFNDSGKIIDYIILSQKTGNYAVEIIPKTWHSIIALENNSVVYEIKDGPYDSNTDKVFPDWAPEETNKTSVGYLNNLLVKLNNLTDF